MIRKNKVNKRKGCHPKVLVSLCNCLLISKPKSEFLKIRQKNRNIDSVNTILISKHKYIQNRNI